VGKLRECGGLILGSDTQAHREAIFGGNPEKNAEEKNESEPWGASFKEKKKIQRSAVIFRQKCGRQGERVLK